MGPELQPDVNVIELIAYAALNPATIATAFLMGRKADEKPKILIAGFAGAVAGVALLYVAALFKIWDAPMLGRAGGGIFAAGLLAGVLYGWLGFITRR
ncbi:MAG: hypothetical protein ABL897_10935 [Hyphomicrobium sp.]